MSVDRETLKRRGAIAAALRRILAADSVIDDEIALAPYETDALTAYRQPPMIVALPASTEEVAAVLR
jgi:glycolate oxidase